MCQKVAETADGGDIEYEAIMNRCASFTGNEISMKNKEKPLYIAVSGSLHLGDPEASRLTLDPKRDYYIKENIFEEKNWGSAE
jgi:hypothetical protein